MSTSEYHLLVTVVNRIVAAAALRDVRAPVRFHNCFPSFPFGMERERHHRRRTVYARNYPARILRASTTARAHEKNRVKIIPSTGGGAYAPGHQSVREPTPFIYPGKITAAAH
jgi:hypothetical protein